MKKSNWMTAMVLAACVFIFSSRGASAMSLTVSYDMETQESLDAEASEMTAIEALEEVISEDEVEPAFELREKTSEDEPTQSEVHEDEDGKTVETETEPAEIPEDSQQDKALDDGKKPTSDTKEDASTEIDGDDSAKKDDKDSAKTDDDSENKQTDPYENKAVYDFVVRMYDKVLGRTPEENGVKFWYENIVSGKKSGADVAAEFFNSPEYIKQNNASDTYIEHLYRTMLNRGSDAGGKQYWLGILDAGVSRDYLLSGFVKSNEYNRRCSDSGIEVGTYVLTQSRDQNINMTRYITHFYQTVLGRRGDERGLNDWTGGLLTNKYNGATILKNFFFSNEYVKKNKADDLYIDDLYKTVFSRNADSAGKTYWLNAFEDNVSRHYPAAGFNDSREYKSLLTRYGISEGEYLWMEARDQKRPVTAYVNRMILEGTGSKADADTLNSDLDSLYQGKTSAMDLVVKYMGADGFKTLSDKDYINKASQLIFGRAATDREIRDGVTLIQYDGRSAMVRQLAACSEFSDFCKENDIQMLNTANDPVMQYAKNRMDLVNWDIRSAYNWILSRFKYVTLQTYYGSNHAQYYGLYAFEHENGNCYAMAAAFYWMAKAKGINIDYIEGVVPGARVARAPHGWCEATINGVRYIYDPDFQYETGRNGYQFVYRTSGTWKYMDGVVMN